MRCSHTCMYHNAETFRRHLEMLSHCDASAIFVMLATKGSFEDAVTVRTLYIHMCIYLFIAVKSWYVKHTHVRMYRTYTFVPFLFTSVFRGKRNTRGDETFSWSMWAACLSLMTCNKTCPVIFLSMLYATQLNIYIREWKSSPSTFYMAKCKWTYLFLARHSSRTAHIRLKLAQKIMEKRESWIMRWGATSQKRWAQKRKKKAETVSVHTNL